MAPATPSANISYRETTLGSGLWQYDYTFFNTSNNNEYLYSVDLLFGQTHTVTGLPLPSGWNSTIWEGEHETDFMVSFSTNISFDIAAGSSLSGFSFTVDYQLRDIAYSADYDDHQGGIFSTSGYTVTPEPLSAVLFFSGSIPLIIRRYLKNK